MSNDKCNSDKGLDYHLKALGFNDRRHWYVISRDDRIYDTGLVRSKPDWVLGHKKQNLVTVIDYKNRDLGQGEASLYEQYQMVIYADTVKWVLSQKKGEDFHVSAALIYGDGQKVAVEYDNDDIVCLEQALLEATPDGAPISATDLARFMVDPRFEDPHFENSDSRRNGQIAHDSIQSLM